jgi:hypothetical protein
MKPRNVAQASLSLNRQLPYQEGSLGSFLMRHGWTEAYIGKLAHPWWRRANGPSMQAGRAWEITMKEMSTSRAHVNTCSTIHIDKEN